MVSNSLTPKETEPWQNSTRIIKRSDFYEEITRLKNQSGKDILIFGSRTLWNDLLEHGLVDELHMMIGPVAIGAGTPIFEGKPSVSFRLKDAQTWEGSGTVLIRYEVIREKILTAVCFHPARLYAHPAPGFCTIFRHSSNFKFSQLRCIVGAVSFAVLRRR